MEGMFTEDPERRHAIAEIDALRGTVILLVFCGSYLTAFPARFGAPAPIPLVPSVAFLALQLFLALAGYRVMLDLSHQRTGARFLLARALRNLPALWVAVPLALIAARACVPALQAPFSAAWANLFMAADVYGVPVADPAFWRLKIELLLACFAGLAWFAAGPRGFGLAILGGLCLCALASAGEPAHRHVLTWAGAATLDGYLPHGAFGIALCRLVELPLENRNERRLWWLVAALCLGLVVRGNPPVHAAFVLLAYALVGMAAFGRASWLRSLTSLGALGRLSYPIYVVHMVPGFVVMRVLIALHVPGFAAASAAAAGACALGFCVHRWVELPTRKAVCEGIGRLRVPGTAILAEPAS